MLKVDVQMDMASLTRALNAIERDAIRPAAVQALNRVARTVKSRAVKAISAETGMKQASIRDLIAIRQATKLGLIAEVSASRHAPNLIHYSARQTKRGVSASAWRKRKVYKGTFIANKGRTVFRRVGKGRLPIKPVFGPSLPRTFINKTTHAVMTRTINERFPVEFNAALINQLRRRGLRA